MSPDRVPLGELPDAALNELLRQETGARLVAVQAEVLRRLPVRQMVGGGYLVPSRTTKGAWWLVYAPAGQPWECSCPATTGRCWHVRTVERYCAIDSAMHRRPEAPPNVAGLVD